MRQPGRLAVVGLAATTFALAHHPEHSAEDAARAKLDARAAVGLGD
jgi:hypothetical protein